MHNQIKLFASRGLTAVEDEVVRSASAQASSVTLELVESRSEESIAADITSHFELEPLEFDEGSVQISEPRERTISVPDGFSTNAMVQVPGIQIEVECEVSGDERLWSCQPNLHHVGGPQYLVDLDGSRMAVEMRFAIRELGTDGFNSAVDEFVAFLKENIRNINSDVDRINKGILPSVRNAITRRVSELKKLDTVVSSTRYPIKARQTKAMTVPVKRVPFREKRQKAGRTGYANDTQPHIAHDDFREIVRVVQQVALAIERSPTAFAKMGEEQIRDIVLVFLNGYFEGRAGGETFNVSGKTDILINEKGKNVFIAECKFWGGSIVFSATIDQLLGYLGWRDTRALVLVFNKNKDVSGSLSVARSCLAERDDHVREISFSSENLQIESVLKCADDSERQIYLTTLMFSVPE